MFGACVVYAGFVAAFLGGISILKPLAFLGIHTRLTGLFAFVLGIFVVFPGWVLPASDVHIASARTHLDEFAPNYQFGEFHSIRVSAPRERVFLAMKAVTADEMLLFRSRTWIRRLRRDAGDHRNAGLCNQRAGAPAVSVVLAGDLSRQRADSPHVAARHQETRGSFAELLKITWSPRTHKIWSCHSWDAFIPSRSRQAHGNPATHAQLLRCAAFVPSDPDEPA